MAEWDRNKVNPSDINGGKQFTANDNLAVNELNAMVNNSFYAVDFAEAMADEPDISEIDGDGVPSVSLITNQKDGKYFKKLKFSNLKGSKGEQGERGEKGEKGEAGESNALIKYLGDIAINQMSVRDFFELIRNTFGTTCSTYYITSPYSHNITFSAEKDGVNSNLFLHGYLLNKCTGETISLYDGGVKSFSTRGVLGIDGSVTNNNFKYRPYIDPDYVEIHKCKFDGYSPITYNVRCVWSVYELNVLDFGSSISQYIKSPTAVIHVYGVV